ncbi:hypothetical protein JCM3765_006636 [Sporobolomyces pararoseus]
MGYDELEDFDLEAPSVAITPTSTPHPPSLAATPASLLRLQVEDNPPQSSGHYSSSPISSVPSLVIPSSPNLSSHSTASHFPFPSPSINPSPSWSPALTSISPNSLLGRPRLCVQVEREDNHSPTTLATPPSPLGLPGTYNLWTLRSSLSSGSSPKKRKSVTRESFEGELLLPPPFLDEDDSHSTRKSFEGILGWKYARQAEKTRLEHEKLYALGRSPPLPFPQSLFKTLSKLIDVLGPPGGYEQRDMKSGRVDGKMRAQERLEQQQRRRVQRAESGLKAYEFGTTVGGGVAGKLRRRVSYRRGQGEHVESKESRSTKRSRLENDMTPSDQPTPLSPSLDTNLPKVDYFKSASPARTPTTPSHGILEFAVWILIGSFDEPEHDTSISSLGGIIGLFVHLVGFSFFVTAHTSSLAASSVFAFRSVIIFLYWLTLNLCGRTDLSRAVIAYWKSCRKEWDRVCVEEEGSRGLTAWSVMRGLVELAALHSMTRDRWLAEELKLLNYEEIKEKTQEPSSTSVIHRRASVKKAKSPGVRPSRPSFTIQQSSFCWNRTEEEEQEEEADGLVVTSNGGSLLEGTLITSPDYTRPTERRRNTFSPTLIPAIVDELTEEPASINSSSSASPSEDRSRQKAYSAETPVDIVALFSLLKRCGRLSTAAYGLQTYIISPPTPLLTPSGATLPHRLFAHLGGVKDHRNVLHVALQQSRNESPEVETVYAPTFYLLRDDSRRQVIVVFRGTQSLADIKTDLEGEFVPLELPSTPANSAESGRSTPYRIHAGILAAARHLLDPHVSPLFSKLATSLEETGYDLLLTGHSLGSALASTIALLVSSYDPIALRWTTSTSSGLPSQRLIRAITFAHPTTLNAPLASRCAIGSPSLVLSVSLASDIITRAGLPQLRELRRTLGRLDRVRQGNDGIIRDWWKWRKLSTEVREDAEGTYILTRKAELRLLEETAWRRRLQVEDDSSKSLDGRIDSATPAGKAYHLDRLPPHLEEAERHRAHERTGGRAGDEDAEEGSLLLGLYEVTDPRRFYRAPLLSSDLIRSHLPKEYLDAVESL